MSPRPPYSFGQPTHRKPASCSCAAHASCSGPPPISCDRDRVRVGRAVLLQPLAHLGAKPGRPPDRDRSPSAWASPFTSGSLPRCELEQLPSVRQRLPGGAHAPCRRARRRARSPTTLPITRTPSSRSTSATTYGPSAASRPGPGRCCTLAAYTTPSPAAPRATRSRRRGTAGRPHAGYQNGRSHVATPRQHELAAAGSPPRTARPRRRRGGSSSGAHRRRLGAEHDRAPCVESTPPEPCATAICGVGHLARPALAAQLTHRFDEQEHAVLARVRVREPAAVGVHRAARRPGRACRLPRTRRLHPWRRTRDLRGATAR